MKDLSWTAVLGLAALAGGVILACGYLFVGVVELFVGGLS